MTWDIFIGKAGRAANEEQKITENHVDMSSRIELIDKEFHKIIVYLDALCSCFLVVARLHYGLINQGPQHFLNMCAFYHAS